MYLRSVFLAIVDNRLVCFRCSLAISCRLFINCLSKLLVTSVIVFIRVYRPAKLWSNWLVELWLWDSLVGEMLSKGILIELVSLL